MNTVYSSETQRPPKKTTIFANAMWAHSYLTAGIVLYVNVHEVRGGKVFETFGTRRYEPPGEMRRSLVYRIKITPKAKP